LRQVLKDLINKTIFYEYSLPNKQIMESINLSNRKDDCYSYSSDENLVELIYHSILDYSYNEFDMNDKDLSVLFSKALLNKIKYNESKDELTKIKYGFYGEVLLYSILYSFYNATPVISRGYFYNPLENSETKGYDSYHLIEKDDKVELWFGEVKFRTTLNSGAKSAIEGLDKAFTDEYLSQNIIAMENHINSFNIFRVYCTFETACEFSSFVGIPNASALVFVIILSAFTIAAIIAPASINESDLNLSLGNAPIHW
jgi:hypothetical protein